MEGSRAINHPALFLFLASLAFGCNVALGQLRVRARRLSPAWFLWIHVSVPPVVLLRLHWDLKPSLLVIPVLIACAIAGQVVGGRVRAPRTASG